MEGETWYVSASRPASDLVGVVVEASEEDLAKIKIARISADIANATPDEFRALVESFGDDVKSLLSMAEDLMGTGTDMNKLLHSALELRELLSQAILKDTS